jgi:hypothetical protein
VNEQKMATEQLTAERVNQLFEGVELNFSGYYKYYFRFIGSKDGYVIAAAFGGNASDIYKETVKPKRIFGQVEDWNLITVENAEREKCFDYVDLW